MPTGGTSWRPGWPRSTACSPRTSAAWGDSEHRPQYTWRQVRRGDHRPVIEQLGIAGCIAIGHSFGGRAPARCLHATPGLFARAIVMDSRLGTPDDPLRGFDEEWRPKKHYPNADDDAAPVRTQAHRTRARCRHGASRPDVHPPRRPPGWAREVRRERHAPVPAAAASAAPAWTTPSGCADLPTPVDFIYGENSRVVTPARAALLAGCLPKVCPADRLPVPGTTCRSASPWP